MNKFNLGDLLRSNIRAMKPYSSARDEYSGEAKIFIDANENPYGSEYNNPYNRYPDPYQLQLKEKISSIKGVPVENIFLGNGSDEAIDLLFKAFCYPYKDKVTLTPPTYGMYEVSAETNGTETIKILQTADFQPDVAKIKASISPENKILFLCSPNNPTGNCIEESIIVDMLESFPGIVVVDEAYVDFTSAASWTKKLDQYPNLVVLQTLSKAWGLANLRLGMMFASKEIISIINKIKLPYNLSGLTQEVVSKALDAEDKKNEYVQNILNERTRMVKELNELEIVQHIYPTDANFILAKFPNAREVYVHLLKHNIVVRDRSSQPLCEGCLRITIGTKQENDALIEAVKEL